MNTIVKLENVSKSFDNGRYVINNLNLDIYEGEFVTLLGSSGCGKTTILRLISGLENVTNGKVYIGGIDVTNVDASKREVNTIFQNFALFPHMTVFENVSFGLRMRKEKIEVIKKEVTKALKLVNLEGYEDRYPAQLSGGQQQRVAIARGIVMHPKVLLLDESLCSLDLKLKRTMQIELKKIQKKLGLTFIYVTHDQDEALTMSDRIVIIEDGKVLQDDTPQNIYCKPKTTFVADFIGESNIFKVIVKSVKESVVTAFSKENMEFIFDGDGYKSGDKLSIMVRPENIIISKQSLDSSVEGTISDYIYDGIISKVFVSCFNGSIVKVTVPGSMELSVGDKVYMKIDKNSIIPILEKNNEKK